MLLNGTNLYKIDIQSENINIGAYAFYNLRKLTEINSTINSLDEHAFEGCYLLDNLILSDTLETIEDYTFSGCYNLENITIPENTTSIGKSAFFNTNIKSITIPYRVKTIKEYAFAECQNLQNITIQEGLIEIEDYAFHNAINLISLYIPKSVISVGNHTFEECSGLEKIIVNEENEHYDSRNNCNALIETETNTLLAGSCNTKVPNTVKIIGQYSFFKNWKLTEIDIPEGIIEIQDYAFYDCDYLEEITIPESVQTIGNNAFDQSLVLWVHKDSYAYEYANENNLTYKVIEPTTIGVSIEKKDYKAFETVDKTGMYFILVYEDRREFILEDEISIKYTNDNDSFRYGDTYFTAIAYSEKNVYVEKQVEVTVEKAIPEYTVPTGLTGKVGQTLSEIELPEGFEWMDDSEILSKSGNAVYKAKYTPKDVINYEIIEDIEITISVVGLKEEIIPEISIENKIYDGTKTIDTNSIVISNLYDTEYTIESAEADYINVGKTTATVRIKLTDEKFENYTLENGEQEKEYTVDIEIIPALLSKPTKAEKTYTYNEEEQEVEINGFDENKMRIIGNKRTDAGEQTVTISLIDTNYIWEDNTTEDIIFTFKIEKANIEIAYISSNNSVVYDGQKHGIIFQIVNSKNINIRYIDNNDEYTLEEMPKYSEVGTYTIKYRIFIDNNYTDIFGEQTLVINKYTITNNTTDYEGIYDGQEHTININIDISDYDIKYSLDDTSYNLNEAPKFTNIGEYTINYKITNSNCEDIYGSNKVRIYGIKTIDSSVTIKDNILVITTNTFSDLTNKFTIYSKSTTFYHYDSSYKSNSNDLLKTGDIIKINLNNSNNYEYNISVLGDVNGDGKISALDYVKIKNHIMKTTFIDTGVYLIAADVNEDNKVSALDYVKVKNHIMNGAN